MAYFGRFEWLTNEGPRLCQGIVIFQGFRFFFFSGEGDEPPHIHVEHGDKVAKFWLEPVQLASSESFRSYELTKIRAMVIEHKNLFMEKWNEHFGN